MSLTHSHVLVVDDQRSFQVMLKGMLNNIGFNNIEMCETGEQACKYCDDRPFQLLLVDYNLGVNKKNGRQLLEELRGKGLITTEAIFIIVTGENSRAMVLGALENQPDDYIMKPFSQRQLSSRIERAHQKRQAMQSVLQPLNDKNYPEAIAACHTLIAAGSKYSNHCKNLLAELYCKVGQYEKSEQFLKALLAERDITWAKVALAKAHMGLKRYDVAIQTLEELLTQHPLLLDAHDLKAQCQYMLDQPEQALQSLQDAAEISPHSIERQQHIARLSREVELSELTQNTYQTIYELSKRSLHHNVEHLLNYVRSTFEAAESAEEATRRHKYQHEAMNALFRARHDNLYGNFDFATFEGLCQAKLEAAKGELIKAKKSYYNALKGLVEQGKDKLPIEFSGEGLITLCQIGEFEEMQHLAERMQKSTNLGTYARDALQSYQADDAQHERVAQFRQCHQDGSRYYEQGNYDAAVRAFRTALSLAPTNTGAALNMIQSLLQLCKAEKKPHELLRECKEFFRLLDGVSLPSRHKIRYQDLKQSYNKLQQK
ncbi:response regulator [Corallincola luteus]|uniref:Response regulator n=1 Tax=Corallincola luteus TaxID=1775177 RepID=A0ABY2ALD8_9GAMM|nr:response regulator [Corallincola luteus]TCI03328.1 response regulator [Corallincola luteus]